MIEYSPTLTFRDAGNGSDITAIVSNSYDNSINDIYIRERYGVYSEEKTTVVGDQSVDITLGTPGFYYAKLVSHTDIGDTNESEYLGEEVILQVLDIPDDPELSDGGVKNIDNVEVESVTNTLFGNQFIGYFLKIPQVGYYQDVESKSLKPYVTDRVNETITGVNIPDTAISMIPISYYAHQNEQFMGVGNGELGILSLGFKLDRYLQNYTAFLNWSYLKYDWTFGGKNPDNNMKDHDIHGTFVTEFIDADEKRTRKIGYKVIIETLPGLNLSVKTPDDVEFEVGFKVVDIDTSQFVMGEPLSDSTRIF